MEDNVINRLVPRLRKIGIDVELIGNIPWIYLRKVNGNTKNINKEEWNNIWRQYLNEPQWKEASGIVFKEANPVSIAVGPKTP